MLKYLFLAKCNTIHVNATCKMFTHYK